MLGSSGGDWSERDGGELGRPRQEEERSRAAHEQAGEVSMKGGGEDRLRSVFTHLGPGPGQKGAGGGGSEERLTSEPAAS